MNRYEEATADARLLMPTPEVVLVARFEVPAESVLPRRPEHKVQNGFATDGVRCPSVRVGMNPLGANANHELCFWGQGPRFLE